MKPQHVFAAKPAGLSAQPVFRASTSQSQPERLSFKDLVRTLGSDFETNPSTWRRAIDHCADVVVFYQMDLLATVPHVTKSVRITRESRSLVPSVYVGDMLMEDTYVIGIIGQAFLMDVDDLMKLLGHADRLFTADAEGQDMEAASEVACVSRAAKLKAPLQRAASFSIRDEGGKTTRKRKSGHVYASDRASPMVEKSGTAPVRRNTRARNTREDLVAAPKERGPSQEDDSSRSDPECSGTDERNNSTTLPSAPRFRTRQPTPFRVHDGLPDSHDIADESSLVSGLSADDDPDDNGQLGRGESQSGPSGQNDNAGLGLDMAIDEEEQESASATSTAGIAGLTCTQCQRTLSTIHKLRRHVREVHQKLDRAVCPKCKKPVLARHMTMHLRVYCGVAVHKPPKVGIFGRPSGNSSSPSQELDG